MRYPHNIINYSFGFVLLIAILLPSISFGSSVEELKGKRIVVAMRMIGHEILKCVGDNDSRVLPIEKIDDNSYHVTFEREFGFDPGDFAEIVDRVVEETKLSVHLLVEVKQCSTKKVVHSFIMGPPTDSEMIACGGRVMPLDCYGLLVSVLPEAEMLGLDELSINYNVRNNSKSQRLWLIIPALLLLGLIGFIVRKKQPKPLDPNLIQIGASKFDKRNLTLTYEKRIVELSGKEADLLILLHASLNNAVERQDILHKVWGDEGDYVGRTLDVFISKLRKKLEPDGSLKIINIRGVGYKLISQ